MNTYMTVAVATADARSTRSVTRWPPRIASSKGTNGTLSHLVSQHGQSQVQYELPAGAIGARHNKDGVSASKAHVANGTLTPIEVVEASSRSSWTIRVGHRFRRPWPLSRGLGYVRDYWLLGDAKFSSRTGRDITRPQAGRWEGRCWLCARGQSRASRRDRGHRRTWSGVVEGRRRCESLRRVPADTAIHCSARSTRSWPTSAKAT